MKLDIIIIVMLAVIGLGMILIPGSTCGSDPAENYLHTENE